MSFGLRFAALTYVHPFRSPRDKMAGRMGAEKQGGLARPCRERFRDRPLPIATRRPLRRGRLPGEALLHGLQEPYGRGTHVGASVRFQLRVRACSYWYSSILGIFFKNFLQGIFDFVSVFTTALMLGVDFPSSAFNSEYLAVSDLLRFLVFLLMP